jgi:Trypsin
MRFRPGVVLALALAFVMATAGVAAASGRAPAKFMKPNIEKKLSKKGAKGVSIPLAALNTECPGVQSPGVSAGGCIVAPYGCTANFIFTDGASEYVGTARHCVDNKGQQVTMQVDTTTIAVVGTVSHMTSGGGEPGNDWALIQIDPAVAAKWGVNPAVPVVGGPQGIYTGCDVTGVKYYGPGYGVAVAQGKAEFGVATNWNNDGYGWTGFGAPGDSGSPVLTAAGQAAGNFTHLIVDIGEYPGSDHAGTRIAKALSQFNVSLVNADGSLTGAAGTNC